MGREKIISYALDFSSFLVYNLKNSEMIKDIILFGSATRGEASEKSDVDIFINVKKSNENFEKQIKLITKRFYESIKFKKYWKLLGIENSINPVVGNLRKWKLRTSVLVDGITLYGKYTETLKERENIAVLSWGAIKPNSKRVLLNKRIYGYNHYGKFYSGALQKYEGKKLDNSIIIPLQHLPTVLKIFREMKITIKIIEAFRDLEVK